jgi:hypothetical protein
LIARRLDRDARRVDARPAKRPPRSNRVRAANAIEHFGEDVMRDH